MQWNYAEYPQIEALLDNSGRLILRKPGANAIAANVFTAGQEEKLWAKVLASGLDADSSSFTLFKGFDESREHKPYIAEPAAILNGNGNNKAYEAWQLAQFKYVHIEMRVNHGNPQLCLMAVLKPASNKKAKKVAPVLTLPTLDGEKPAPQTKAPQRKGLNLGNA